MFNVYLSTVYVYGIWMLARFLFDFFGCLKPFRCAMNRLTHINANLLWNKSYDQISKYRVSYQETKTMNQDINSIAPMFIRRILQFPLDSFVIICTWWFVYINCQLPTVDIQKYFWLGNFVCCHLFLPFFSTSFFVLFSGSVQRFRTSFSNWLLLLCICTLFIRCEPWTFYISKSTYDCDCHTK